MKYALTQTHRDFDLLIVVSCHVYPHVVSITHNALRLCVRFNSEMCLQMHSEHIEMYREIKFKVIYAIWNTA